MMKFGKTPKALQWIYPSLIWRKSSKNCIYLTFDDGPNPQVTKWVVDELSKFNAKATFFCVGENVLIRKHLVQLLTKNGHQVANHSFSHLNGWYTNTQTYLKDVSECKSILQSEGIETNYFRPPYGKLRWSQIRKLSDHKIVMWSHLAWDFDSKVNIEKSLECLKRAKPGSILTMHDSMQAFENLKIILPELLKHFHCRGMSFQRLDHD